MLFKTAPCNQEKPLMINSKDSRYNSADVVFVVQDNKCNTWASSSLPLLVNKMDKQLKLAGKKHQGFARIKY